VRHKDGDWHTVGYSSLVASPKKARPSKDSVLAVVLLHNQGACDEVADKEHTLRVFMLGRFALTMAGEGIAIDSWARKQSITLLKFLVTQTGRPVHRERILDSLWPTTDTRRGWDRLKVTISYLRQQLRELGLDNDVLKTVGKAYVLRRDAIRVDADVFENLIAEGHALQSQNRDAEALRRFCQADDLYRGDYLEEETFADWCAEERERLRELYLEMLGDMVRCHAASGNYGEAVRLSRRALVQEPCRESFHATLIRNLARLGHAGQAAAQYRTCRKILADELGVEPMSETRQLYRRILKNPPATGMSS
jgi:two-component SAPR family response regulator